MLKLPRIQFVIDTNVWLELLLEQERAPEVSEFLRKVNPRSVAITEFAVYSIGVILIRLKKPDLFVEFIDDIVRKSEAQVIRLSLYALTKVIESHRQFNLDFDDSYQYAVAKIHGIPLISFDRDFKRTDINVLTPAEAIRDA
ncbi:MAG: PIN domain-containing protein, partial [Calditrichaeota bacterium]